MSSRRRDALLRVVYALGDKVTLNSGGPPMEVRSVDSKARVTCAWMADGVEREGVFPLACLQRA